MYTNIEADNLLFEALDFLKSKWGEPNAGFVACALKDQGKTVYTTNLLDDTGHIVHAERLAVSLFKEKYGKISDNAIVAVTLSPCIFYSKNRIGDSCANVLLENQIERIHFGLLHEKQGTLDFYNEIGFNASNSKNSIIKKQSQSLLDFYVANKNFSMNGLDTWSKIKKRYKFLI